MVKLTKKQIKELYSTPIGYRKHGEKNIPVFTAIKAEGYGGRVMKFLCPECDVWHKHGITEEIGHRSPHCGDRFIVDEWGITVKKKNPLRDTGYYIVRIDER